MSDFLKQNLEFVEINNPGLAQSVANLTEISSEFAFLNTQQGETVLAKDGVLLNSPLSPLSEAKDLFHNLSRNDEKDIAIIMGFELGYLFSYFATHFKGSIIVWEPCLETLRLTMELLDYSKSFNRLNIFFASNNAEINKAIAKLYRRTGKFHIVANKHYFAENHQLMESLDEQLKDFEVEPYSGGPVKLNIGAGVWAYKNWRTLDFYKEADFFADLRSTDPLPIEDGMVEKAFSSHCIEHLSNDSIQHFLNEMNRCMAPGAVLRISCPDVDLAFKAYEEGNEEWFNWLKKSHIGEMLLNSIVSYEYMAGGPEASAEVVKEKFETLSKDEFIDWAVSMVDETKPYVAHRNGIHFEKLKAMLEKAGFKNVQRSSFGASNDEELRATAFDRYPEISLYVECTK